jgi:hypothetical protein
MLPMCQKGQSGRNGFGLKIKKAIYDYEHQKKVLPISPASKPNSGWVVRAEWFRA